MKILQVIPSVSPRLGGPSHVMIELGQHLQTSGIDLHLLSTDDDAEERLDVPLNQTIDYQGIPTTFLPRTLRAKEFIYSHRLNHWHRQHLASFDLVHTHYIFSYLSSFTARAARRCQIPYVMRPLGQLTPWALSQSKAKKQLYASLIERQNLQRAARVHCTSAEEAENVRAFGIKTPTMVLPLGVTEPERIPNAKQQLCQRYRLSPDVPILLFLSRLHHKKQPEILLQAVAQQLKQQPCHVLMAGEGDPHYVDQLKEWVVKLGLQNHVTFTGFVTGRDKNCLLQGADLFVLPSHSENFGIAVAEALICKLPVVISSGIQISPEIQAANAGVVVDANVPDFTEAIHQVLSQPNRRKQLSENGFALAKRRYAWTAIARELTQTYEQIVHQHRSNKVSCSKPCNSSGIGPRFAAR